MMRQKHRNTVTYLLILLPTLLTRVITSTNLQLPLPSQKQQQQQLRRSRQAQEHDRLYYRTNDTAILGEPNFMAAIGNPLKGLASFGSRDPRSTSYQFDSIWSALEFYPIGLDDIMIGDNMFNWTTHDALLASSASRNMHAVLSVFIHWPGEPLRIPPHLIDIPFYETDNGFSPNYGEPRLLTALQQFIAAWAQHIDGDKRVAAIHIGLLGFWGEGHTYPDLTLVPESSQQLVAEWYREAFNKTQIQARYPGPNADGFGLYDASLGYSTLDGTANGGVQVDWYMYPQMIRENQQSSWKRSMIGGETRPELQNIIFTDTYPARTEHHQDLKECIDTLHISYVLHHGAFQDGGYTGTALDRANTIHAYMGYAFSVTDVAALTTTTTDRVVDISVRMMQSGVAPFYYDLNLQLTCDNGTFQMMVAGVDKIIEQGQSSQFQFRHVPAKTECLDRVTLSLHSSYASPTRPVRFAQGTDGTNITFAVPLPPVVLNSSLSPTPISVSVIQPSIAPIATKTIESDQLEQILRQLILVLRSHVARIREQLRNGIFR